MGTLVLVSALPQLARKVRQQITPSFAFDVCHQAYEQAHSRVFEQTIRALDATDYHDHLWRPDRRARPKDFIADFAITGRQALREIKTRRELFEQYYVGREPYEVVRKNLDISEMTWCIWTDQIRNIVGEALIDKDIFPPNRYFGS